MHGDCPTGFLISRVMSPWAGPCMEAYLTLPFTKLNHVYFDAVLFTRSRMSASATLGGSFLITTFVLSMTILQSPTLYQCLVCVTPCKCPLLTQDDSSSFRIFLLPTPLDLYKWLRAIKHYLDAITLTCKRRLHITINKASVFQHK